MLSVLFYWINCFLSMMLAHIGIKAQKSNLSIAAAASLPLVIVSSIRYGVGTDFFSYEDIFYEIAQGNEGRYEWLWVIVNEMVILMGGGFQWVLFISAVIFLGCIYMRVLDDSPSPVISIFLLMGSMVYFTYCNGLRQMLGAAICFYSLKYVYEKKLIKFIISITLAAGFHMSCWLFLVIYFFRNKNIYRFFIAVISVMMLFFYDFVAENLREAIEGGLYGGYLLTELDNVGMQVYITFVVLCFSIAIYNRYDEKYRLYFVCQFMMAFFMCFSWNIPLIFRCGWIFWIPQIVLITMCLQRIESKYLRAAITYVISLLFFSYSSYSIMINGTHNVVPYHTFFDN